MKSNEPPQQQQQHLDESSRSTRAFTNNIPDRIYAFHSDDHDDDDDVVVEWDRFGVWGWI